MNEWKQEVQRDIYAKQYCVLLADDYHLSENNKNEKPTYVVIFVCGSQHWRFTALFGQIKSNQPDSYASPISTMIGGSSNW